MNRIRFAPRFSTLPLALLLPLLAASPAAAVELTGEAADAFNQETLVDGLAEPTDILVLADGRAVITQRGGDIAILADGGQTDDHINVHTDAGEQGLLSVVADPNFATNHYLYFYASTGDEVENRHKVLRVELGADNQLGEPTIIVDEGLLGPANHNGGGLIIDDNYIYLSVGDTGHNATPPNNRLGTCLNSTNGKILRVALDGSTPPENPLVGQTGVTGCASWDQDLQPMDPDERIYAWGFRNPFRFWVDPMTGLLWVGDVGEGAREEISVGEGGLHYGWPFREGAVEYDEAWMPANACMGVTPATECVPVAHDYPHENGDNCVIGGLILDACGWPDVWKGRYIFGDHGSGRVWTLNVNAGRTGVENGSLQEFGDGDGLASFRIGADNALYIVDDKAGTVQRITPKMATGEDCGLPPGGSGGTGGMTGTSGSGGNGGTGMSSGGTGAAPTAGSGPSSGSGGTNGATDAQSSEDGGCGCRAVGSGGMSAGLALFASALGLAWARRRRGRSVR